MSKILYFHLIGSEVLLSSTVMQRKSQTWCTAVWVRLTRSLRQKQQRWFDQSSSALQVCPRLKYFKWSCVSSSSYGARKRISPTSVSVSNSSYLCSTSKQGNSKALSRSSKLSLRKLERLMTSTSSLKDNSSKRRSSMDWRTSLRLK